MDQQLCVLLYSKYSKQSKRYIDILKQSPVDITSITKLKTLCIDNETVRQRILNSQQIDIISVPCILIVYQDGGVEKYEGGTAFKWLEEIIKSHSPPPPVQIEPSPPSPQRQSSKKSKENRTNSKSPIPTEIQKSTSIEDLDSESEEITQENTNESEEITQENFNMKPPAAIRSGIGNYDFQGEFGEIEETNRNVTRGIKSSTEPGIGGKGSLMAAAMAMQKSREENEPKRPPGAAPQKE